VILRLFAALVAKFGFATFGLDHRPPVCSTARLRRLSAAIIENLSYTGAAIHPSAAAISLMRTFRLCVSNASEYSVRMAGALRTYPNIPPCTAYRTTSATECSPSLCISRLR
jgi:hypothetical protein